MTIAFSPNLYSAPVDVTLKLRLEALFKRSDVVIQMRAVASHVLSGGARTGGLREGYGMSSWGLDAFNAVGDADAKDPHYLCAAIMHVLTASEKDRDMPKATREGLKSVVKQMLTIVNTESTEIGELKNQILHTARSVGMIDNKGKGVS